jgi:hypothetical protein
MLILDYGVTGYAPVNSNQNVELHPFQDRKQILNYRQQKDTLSAYAVLIVDQGRDQNLYFKM